MYLSVYVLYEFYDIHYSTVIISYTDQNCILSLLWTGRCQIIQQSFSNLRERAESEGLESTLKRMIIIMIGLKYLLLVVHEHFFSPLKL